VIRRSAGPPAPAVRPDLLRARADQLLQAVRAFRPVTTLERQCVAKLRREIREAAP
jgi:hypothetical protein